MGLSALGIFHTAIGVIAIISATVSYVRFGKIDLSKSVGKIYFYFTLITSLTALGLSKHGGFNPGHALSIIVIISVAAAYFLFAKRTGNTRARYWENFFLSFSFFLSMIPTTNETLTRIPVGHPFASSPADPLVANSLLVILIVFVIGSVYQFLQQRQLNK